MNKKSKRILEWRTNMVPKSGASATRVRSDDGVFREFDELVIWSGKSGKCLVHVEMMNNREYFVQVGDEPCMWVSVDKDGKITVNHDR